MKPMVRQPILVLGGNGFIGSAVVKELHRRGFEAIIGTRANNRFLRPGERRIAFHTMTQTDWLTAIEGCSMVINAVGIMRERRHEKFRDLHCDSVANIAEACLKHRIPLIHVSALGLDQPITSEFLTSKREGEARLRISKADWYIVRPSLLEGEHGYGAKWFRRLAKWPIHIVPAAAIGKVAPLHVNDLAKRIVNIVVSKPMHRTHEMGGDKAYHYPDYLIHLARRKPWVCISVSDELTRLCCRLFDFFRVTPLCLGHYELMLHDNVPKQKQERVKELPRAA